MPPEAYSEEKQKLVNKLSRSRLFGNFSMEELEGMVGVVRFVRFRKGELIFKEGDMGQELFLVEDGRVAISKPVKGNLEQVLAHLGPGEYFGEMAVLDKIPRTASASAEEDTVLMVIGEDDLVSMMESQPKAAAKILYNLLKTFSDRLRATNEQGREAVRWGLEATGYDLEV